MELPSCGVMLPRTAEAAGRIFHTPPSLTIAAPFMRNSISSVAGRASRGIPEVVRMVTVPPTCGSMVYDSLRMSVRMLRTTSRRSAPSKLSDTAAPPGAAETGAGGRPPPGNCPLTSWPLPLNSFAWSAAASGEGPVILIVPCMGLAGFDQGEEASRSGLVVQPTSSRNTARPCNGAERSLGMRGFLGATT